MNTKKKQLNLQDYEEGKTVGTGSFGRVKIFKNKRRGNYVAIKIMKKEQIIQAKQVDHMENEIKVMSLIEHPFVVQFIGFTQDSKYLYIGMEYVCGGELFSYLRGRGHLSVPQSRFYISQIICIFEYLHSKNIIYRDLKPENVLIHKNGYLKLTDFGFGKIVEDKTYTLCGTPEYLAPEVILNKGHGKPVDWWTCGILLYEMIVGIDPFSDDDPLEIYKKIIECKPKFPNSFDTNAKSLIKHFLEIDVSKRFGNLKNGVRDIKNHKFFKDFDWLKLVRMEMMPFYIPKTKSDNDTSNFGEYPDSDSEVEPLPKNDDPFLSWHY